MPSIIWFIHAQRGQVDGTSVVCALQVSGPNSPSLSIHLEQVPSSELLVFPETAEGYVDKVRPNTFFSFGEVKCILACPRSDDVLTIPTFLLWFLKSDWLISHSSLAEEIESQVMIIMIFVQYRAATAETARAGPSPLFWSIKIAYWCRCGGIASSFSW